MGVEFQALTWETVDTDEEHLVSIFGKTENGKSICVQLRLHHTSSSSFLNMSRNKKSKKSTEFWTKRVPTVWFHIPS
jgi:GTP cyclohydrolase II